VSRNSCPAAAATCSADGSHPALEAAVPSIISCVNS
jgi:hypothetical protein